MTIEQPPDEPIAGSAPDLPPSEAAGDGGAMSALPAEVPGVSSDVSAVDEIPGGFAFALNSLREIQRARAGLDAMETALYAAVFEHVDALSKQTAEPIAERDMMIRSACAEIAATLRLSDRAVQRRMSDAYDVYVGFPQTFEALRTGAITSRHVQELVALLPAVLAHGIHDRLTSIAVAVEKADPDDERYRDEIRADVFADIALSGAPLAHGDGLSAIRANVQVSVPVTALVGVADTGAELIGVGPMDADTARTLAGIGS